MKNVGLWFCRSCQRDYKTKEAFCEHLHKYMIPHDPDTIEEDRRKRLSEPSWEMVNGVYRLVDNKEGVPTDNADPK